MQIVDLINKKKYGSALTETEIEFFIRGVTADSFQDYQVSALLMAIWFNGMDRSETSALTSAMTNSGDIIDLSSIQGIKVDKHSTGGVADTTTLITAPLVAACGVKVAKMSGRGLGHTGGTLDKLESIPGFTIRQTMENFSRIVYTTGLSVIGQTASLVPADKKLYALRDVTGTIDSLPLIASSIMSKKLASGSDAIVLDVKTGSGAFMKDPEHASELARIMVDIGNDAGKNTRALVTNMDQPLGDAIGNAIEVQEAIEILKGNSTGDLLDVSKALAVQMLLCAEISDNETDAKQKIDQALTSGAALSRFREMIAAQGGDPAVIDDYSLFPAAAKTIPLLSEAEGYLHHTDAEMIGRAASLLGAGRMKKDDTIDPSVGIWMKIRVGDKVEHGQEMATLFVNKQNDPADTIALLRRAMIISSEKPQPAPLVFGDPVC